MTYTRKTWANGNTVDATEMNRMEDGTQESLFNQFAVYPPSGRAFTTPFTQGAAGAWGRTAGLMDVLPVYLPMQITMDRISVRVATAVPSSVIRIGMYAGNSAWEASGAPLADGTVDGNAAGVSNITVSLTVGPGLYFFAGVAQGGVDGNCSALTIPSAMGRGVYQDAGSITYGDPSGFYIPLAKQLSGVTGALPTLSSPTWTNVSVTSVMAVVGRRA